MAVDERYRSRLEAHGLTPLVLEAGERGADVALTFH